MEFVKPIVDHVLLRLASNIAEEFCLAWGAQVELSKLNKTLSTIKLLLHDAEIKQVKNPLITRWLGNLKDVCLDVDDFLDEVEFQKLRKKVLDNNPGSFSGKVRKLFACWNPDRFNIKMGHKVKKIRERLAEIDHEKREFALLEVAELAEDRPIQRLLHDNRETDSLVEVSDVIGRESDRKKIVIHLLKNSTSFLSTDHDNVSVISIVGLGGLGKTTLAKLVYNDNMVESIFEMKMWICVSDNFDIQTLVQGILNAATKQKCEDESLDLMKRRLQSTLRGKTFLLVLDDVWDTECFGLTIEKWIDLKALLNIGAKRSKIIITTRNESVGLLVRPIYMHSLQGLPHKDCMTLFMKRAFKNGEEQRYPHLVDIGEDIVKKCGGVPLALTTLGSLLYMKTDQRQWERVRDDKMWSSLGNDCILPALKLSYDALPPYLKPCFAFCSLFPKNLQLNNMSIVPLWMAHGYLKSSREDQDLEEMGLDYIRQFCSRSLFQIEDDLKTIIRFKIHDLVHDLAISVGQVECSTINCRPSISFEKVRHVSLSTKELSRKERQVPDFMLQYEKLRTILVPRGSQLMSQSFFKTCISKFKYIRVLDLNHSSLKKLPRSIGSLCHLRYLNLAGNYKIKRLPNSICKLLNLQYLCLGDCDALEELPKDIGNLINLRSLAITTKQRYLPEGIRRLTLLQCLWFTRCINLRSLGEEIQYLTNLRKLFIDDCKSLVSLPPNMERLTALDTLFINECEYLELMTSGRGPQGLRSFTICSSYLEALPPWLRNSAHSLQSIAFASCHNLTDIQDLQSFKLLERLEISYCSRLQALPQGLHYLKELTELKISGCSELIKICKRQLQSGDWANIGRDTKIIFDGEVWSLNSLVTNYYVRLRTTSYSTIFDNDRDRLSI